MAILVNLIFIRMKNIYAVPGAMLVIIGLLMISAFSSSLGQGLNYMGVSNQKTVFDSGSTLVSLKDSNFTMPFQMITNDVVSATVQSNPRGIDVFMMYLGNSSAGLSKDVIIAHAFNINETSLTFTATSNGNYSLVITRGSILEGVTPDVIVDLTVTRTFITTEQNYLPYAVAIVGVVLLAIGVFSRNGTTAAIDQKKQPTPATQSKTITPVSPAPRVTQTKCKYCGAAMKPGQVFCPSCTKSQV